MIKKIAILGSTGSIGKTLLKIVKKDKKNFKVELLAAKKNYKKILEQAKIYNVKNIIITDIKFYKIAKSKLKNKRLIFIIILINLRKFFQKK